MLEQLKVTKPVAIEKVYCNSKQQDLLTVILYAKADGDALCYDAEYQHQVPAAELRDLVIKQLAVIHFHNGGSAINLVPVAHEDTKLSGLTGIKVHCVKVASTVCTGCTFVSKEDKASEAA